MASPGELVRGLAAILGVSTANLTFYDRVLSQANLRSKRGRGPSTAGLLVPRDAAHLITAVLGTTKAGDAAETVRRYGATQPHRQQSTKRLFSAAGLEELSKLPAHHSFIDALEALIVSGMDGTLAGWTAKQTRGTVAKRRQVMPLIEIAASSPGTIGDVRIAGIVDAVTAQVRYTPPGPWSAPKRELPPNAIDPDDSGADLAQYRSVTARTITHVADLLARRGK